MSMLGSRFAMPEHLRFKTKEEYDNWRATATKEDLVLRESCIRILACGLRIRLGTEMLRVNPGLKEMH